MRIATHRGIGTGCRENSLQALRSARDLGATIFEIDLRCTRDGAVVLCHHKHLGDFGHKKAFVHELTLDDVAARLGKQNCPLTLLSEVLAQMPKEKLILDIKWRGGAATIEALDKLVRRDFDPQVFVERSLFLTWLPEHRQMVKRMFPGATVVLNRTECLTALGAAAVSRVRCPEDERRLISVPAVVFRSESFARRVIRNLRHDNALLMAYLPRVRREVEVARGLELDIVMTDDFSLVHDVPAAVSVETREPTT